MARGLSLREAERLIVRGFFTDLLDRIELEPVREALAKLSKPASPAADVELLLAGNLRRDVRREPGAS